MFGGQKKEEIKRLEQEVLSGQAKLNRYAKAYSEITVRSTAAEKQIGLLEKNQSGMEQQLTKLKNAVSLAAEVSAKQEKTEQLHQEQVQGLVQKLEQSQKSSQKQAEKLRKQKDEMLCFAEQKKQAAAPVNFLSQITAELESELSQITGSLEELDNLDRQMGVISLNAAIEAGRMGESGIQFVAAAEEVRCMAGQYSQLTASFSKALEQIKERLKETEEQAVYLNQLLEEHDINLGKTTEVFSDILSQMEHLEEQNPVPDMKQLLEQTEEIKESKKELEEQYTAALDTMGLVGESFMKQQENLEEIKENLGAVHNQIKSV